MTIMQMEEGLDTGPMLLERELEIDGKTAGQVTEEMAKLGARALIEWLDRSDTARPAARRRRHLCGEDRQGRSPDRLVEGRRARSSGRFAPSIRCPAPGSRPTASGSSCCEARKSATDASGKPGEVLDDRLNDRLRRRPHPAAQGAARRPRGDDRRRAAARLPDPQGHVLP